MYCIMDGILDCIIDCIIDVIVDVIVDCFFIAGIQAVQNVSWAVS